MHTIKGELDLYIYDKEGNLVKHHTQCNYDTIRARLDPNFSTTCNRVTKFECDKDYEYVRPVQYDEVALLPIYLDEPLFAPQRIIPTTSASGDGHYVVSYDKGTTWWTHDGLVWTEVTIADAAELRATGMNGSALESMDLATHMEKYDDHIVIKATPEAPTHVVEGYHINLGYHSSLIDPYYVRWIGDLSVLPRYTLDGLPISSSKSGNVYTINISNLAGVSPIDLDTIYTKVGVYIGTFTYVGLTIEIDQILVGSYTITVSNDQAVFDQRTNNAEYIFWSRTNPTYSDGILGGVRHHGAESRAYIYTYNGGPSENVWMYPFMPDKELRRTALDRSIGLPFSSEAEYGENVVDPDYGLSSSGGVKLWSANQELYSGLGFAPLLFRYVFLNSGDAETTDYLLYYKTRVSTFIGLDRIYPIRYYYDDAVLERGDEANARRHVTYQPMMKDPLNPLMWSYILYDDMTAEGEFIPKSANNPFHDIIIEVHDDHLNIRRYGQEPVFRMEANVNETFKTATATFEDPSGRDLVIVSYNGDDGVYYMSSIPITITRNMITKSFDIVVVGDLTERNFVGNIADSRGNSLAGQAMYDLMRVQQTKGGPWSLDRLATEMKEANDDSFMTALHEDLGNTVDDVESVLDQEWNYRHLFKHGNVTTSTDGFGQLTAELDGTSLLYLKDNKGASDRSMRWVQGHPPASIYMEFQPDLLQNSVLLSSRGGEYALSDTGSMVLSAGRSYVSNLIRTQPAARYFTQFSSSRLPQHFDTLAYMDPSAKTPVVLGMSTSSFVKFTWSPCTPSADLSYDSMSIDGARWQSSYWDPTSLSVKIARIQNTGTGLFLSAYDVDNNTFDDNVEILVDGVSFLHANDCLTSIYTDDTLHPILVIYSGSGWVQEDGIIEVDLLDKTAIRRVTTDTFFPYTNYYEYNDSKDLATTYKDDVGDWITFAVRNPYTGQVYIHNHTSGVVENITMGGFLTHDEFVDVWERTDPQSYYHRRTWSITLIPGTHYALCLITPYFTRYHTAWFEVLIDMKNREVVKKIPTSGYGYYPYTGYSYDPQWRACPAVAKPHGLESTYDRVDEVVHAISAQKNNARYNGYCGWALYEERTDVRNVYSSELGEDLTYQTASANKLIVLEYPDFQLVSLNNKVALLGPNRNIVEYGKGDATPTLSGLDIGGKFTLDIGDVEDPINYIASDLYTGRVKNIVLKHQVPRQGSYKFPCHLYTLGDVQSFQTNFVGNTTFLTYLVSTKGVRGTYFLDTNNSLALTLITDLNLNDVTPNTLAEINGNLANIVAEMGVSADIGLVYYNINGDIGDVTRSETYALYKCMTQAPPWDYYRRRKLATPRMIAKNGNCYYWTTPASFVYNHLNQKIYYNQEGNQYQYGYMNQLQLKDFTAGIIGWNTSNLASTDYGDGGCAWLSIDKEDNIVIRTLQNENYTAHTDVARHFLMSDVFENTYDIGLWVRQVSGPQDNETMVFHTPEDSDTKFYQIPGCTASEYGTLSNQLFMLPISITDRRISTAAPYPHDAPDRFKQTTNASGYKSWGDLRWYFIDGPGTPFNIGEMISFVVCNTIGYAIDNWQVVSSFNTLVKGEIDVASAYYIKHSSAADGSQVGFTKRAGDIDTSSSMIEEPVADDKFFILFDRGE